MRIGALVALLCVVPCRTRSLARTGQEGGSVELACLVPRESTDGRLLVPRVGARPRVVPLTPRTCSSAAATCCCTTARGGWNGRTSRSAAAGFRRWGGRRDGRTERPRPCRYAIAVAA